MIIIINISNTRSFIKTSLIVIFIVLNFHTFSQYFHNPSFEGIAPNPNQSPPSWELCTGTPDTQPFVWDVPTMPSNGESYLGMCWLPSWVERVWTSLSTPFSSDSCYQFKIDLAFYPQINYYGNIQQTFPMKIRIYSSTYYCSEGDLLWESPYIDHKNWITYSFKLEPTEQIENILLRTYYDQAMPEEIGYMLMDNIQIEKPPPANLGNDTTICVNDSILLYPGPGYSEYLWSTGSEDSSIYVSGPGLYIIEAITEYGCSVFDSIEIEVTPLIDLGNDTTICIGDTIEISAGPGFANYMWFNGSSDSTIQLWEVGQYLVWISVTDSLGCNALDSLHLSIIDDSTTVYLGNDTLICYGSDFILYPGFYSQYLWQDGSTDSVLYISEPGIYWVTVIGQCGSASDTIMVDLFPIIELDIGSDTLICDDITLLLDAGPGYTSYFWQDSSTQQTYMVNSTGTYWVSVTDVNGCEATDSIHVGISPAVVVSLGPDTTVCSGETYTLNPGSGFTSYYWQDGSGESTYTVNIPGTYWVTVSDTNGCSGSDTVTVGISPSPDIDLGPDTVICSGNTLFLEPGSQYTSYLWHDNSTLPFYTVTSTGTYSVTVTNSYNCTASDEVFVEVNTAEVNLESDTLLCEGEVVILNGGEGNVSYLWHDSTTQQYYTVDTGGFYSVTVFNGYGCEGYDEITIGWAPLPVADLGGDQSLCEGDTLTLTTIIGPYIYIWDGEISGAFKDITQGGTYGIEVKNQCGSATDQVYIQEYERRDINLGADQVLLPGEAIELDAGPGYDSYLWQDGSTARYFHIIAESINPTNTTYYVEAIEGPCKSSDTAIISLFKIKIPNAITPNGDGNNDEFRPFVDTWNGVNRHHIMVFNRWGEKVWESDNFEQGWDGKRNGSYVADGTYYWVLEIYFGDENNQQVVKGTLSVLGQNY